MDRRKGGFLKKAAWLSLLSALAIATAQFGEILAALKELLGA